MQFKVVTFLIEFIYLFICQFLINSDVYWSSKHNLSPFKKILCKRHIVITVALIMHGEYLHAGINTFEF